MNQPDFDLITFVKDYIWAPALMLIGWAWSRNEKEHDMIRERQEKLQHNTSTGHSVLNDRLMEHVDSTVMELRDEQRRRSDKMTDHITKLFENAERDRSEFNKTMADHREDSFRRHIELMNAINGKADK